MANTLGVYNPIFYAQEALIHLWNALGMASRVHLGYSRERETFEKGDTINIRKPSVLTTVNAPATAEDLSTETVAIVVDQWKEVKFKLSDKELSQTQERIIDDHIAPAAYSLANNIDVTLAALYKDIPTFTDIADAPGSTAVADITGPRRALFANAVPVHESQFMHYMVGPSVEEGFLRLSAFAQHQGAGLEGVDTQLRGTLGMRYGIEVFANQNVQTHTAGTDTDVDQDVNGALTKGATSMNTTLAGTGTIVPGDTFVFADHTQRYAVTTTTTASGNAHTGIGFTPQLVQNVADAVLITFSNDTHIANLMFHRNAFALVVVPLPMIGNELGAKVATVIDPVSGIALRSRIYYVGNSSEVHVAIDVLYGVKTLDPNLATRGRGDVL